MNIAPKEWMAGEAWALASAAFLSGCAVLWTLGYLASSLNAVLVFGVPGLILGFLLRRRELVRRSRETTTGLALTAWLLIGSVFAADGCLLFLFTTARTSDAIASPWLMLPAALFGLFAAASWCLFQLAGQAPRSVFMPLAVLHFFTAFSVSVLVYAIGFGFDPFLHRAAETALFHDGLISPKSPLYAGQYVLVAALAHLTTLPVWLIDKWLVPLLAAITIPVFAEIGFRRGWGLASASAHRATLLLLILPFMPLTFTVPNNLAVVLLLWVVLLWPALVNTRQGSTILLLFAAFSVLVHPLFGVPTVLFALFVIVLGRARTRMQRILVGLIALTAFVVALPALFFLYNHLQGVALAAVNPFDRLPYFLGLFTDPFTRGPQPTPFFWQALYQFRFNVLAGLMLIATAGLLLFGRSVRDCVIPHVIFATGIMVCIFFVSTMFTFKDIIATEQSEFVLRLLFAEFFILFPVLAVAFERVITRLKPSTTLTTLITSTTFAILSVLTAIALYMSQPQSNVKVVLSGPSVSAADLEAVHEIDRDAGGEPYLVLSNQMTSAAAIQEFGFRDYVSMETGDALWYAIPTGGELYKYYSDMTYWRPERFIPEAAARAAGVKTVYFLTYRYWPGFEWISNTATAGADAWFMTSDRAIIIFKYTLP